jgi:putative oxidoreductase
MRPLGNSLGDQLAIVASFALAALFIYAGAEKIRDPLQFADTIYGFAILPAIFISLVALALPVFEIASGVLLLVPRSKRIGALAVALLSLVYFLTLLSALSRGLILNCGCFGNAAPSRGRMWAELGLDAVLMACGSLIYLRSLRQAIDLRWQ